MNLNLKMTVERSKRRSQFLSLVFITKCSYFFLFKISVFLPVSLFPVHYSSLANFSFKKYFTTVFNVIFYDYGITFFQMFRRIIFYLIL